MADTLTERTCGAAAHETLLTCGKMSVRGGRKHHAKEPTRDKCGVGSICYVGGLTCRVVGKSDVEVARDHKRPLATLSTMQ